MATAIQSSKHGHECGNYRFKILVPSSAAGAIIGKGGETIAQLQKDTGTRVIMSKVNDFYPGTNERVCLISGNVEGILGALEFMMEKFKEKPDLYARVGPDRRLPVEREKQVKILVPNSTASMIIGERGIYIKQVKKESGAVVQISQKCNDASIINSTLLERCITVTGEMENNKLACHMILEKIVEDPHSGICSNVSYAEVTGPVANSDPNGSPFANSDLTSNGSMKSMYSNSSASSVSNLSQKATIPESVGSNGGHDSGLGSSFQSNGGHAQFIETVRRYLHMNAFPEHAISEIINALHTLDTFGVLEYVLSVYSTSDYFPRYNSHMPFPSASNSMPSVEVTTEEMQQMPCGASNIEVGFDASMVNGSPLDQPSGFLHFPESRYHHVFLTDAEAAAFDPLYSSSPTLASPAAASLPVRNNGVQAEWSTAGFGTSFETRSLPPNNETVVSDTTQYSEIEVPDNVIGAILGQGGKVLVEIQQLSGANVQISKKGMYAPGTLNRIVTIAGPAHSVCIAQGLIEQQIMEATLKRGQQSAFGTHLTNSFSV